MGGLISQWNVCRVELIIYLYYEFGVYMYEFAGMEPRIGLLD